MNRGGVFVNALVICAKESNENIEIFLSNKEAIVLNSINDFELALALYRKDQKEKILIKQIKDDITSKLPLLQGEKNRDGICLIGHSQIAQWSIDSLCGHRIYNAGISGISSFEYNQLILSRGLLNVGCDRYIVMHGTNDIIWNYDLQTIAESIMKSVEYILNRKSKAKILFLGCAHVNGRLDRNNKDIDEFNAYIKKRFPAEIRYLSLNFLDDDFGNLSSENTIDGLHFSKIGYKRLEKAIMEQCSNFMMDDVDKL